MQLQPSTAVKCEEEWEQQKRSFHRAGRIGSRCAGDAVPSPHAALFSLFSFQGLRSKKQCWRRSTTSSVPSRHHQQNGRTTEGGGGALTNDNTIFQPIPPPQTFPSQEYYLVSRSPPPGGGILFGKKIVVNFWCKILTAMECVNVDHHQNPW